MINSIPQFSFFANFESGSTTLQKGATSDISIPKLNSS